ncbi:PAS domain-containing sensor histidine kinase, partial [bacterium]
HDATDRKEYEQLLEERVAERTSQLLAKNQELEGFTYSVSHDLRSPLRAIVSKAQITLEDEGPNVSAEGKENLERLSAAAKKMAELVDDLLQYARLGTRELRLETVDLAELARAVAADVAGERPGSEFVVRTECDTRVECDPRLVGMALHNLLDNAGKYSLPGERARAEFVCEERDGERVFCVRDAGIGFDMAYVGKLFKPFERLHREEFAGTGIGLANVKRAIERHGGRVWAESDGPGTGARFYFTLKGPQRAWLSRRASLPEERK